MESSRTAESFRGLLLRFRARTGLTQVKFGERVGVHRRSVQDWETGANYPSAARLGALVRVLLETGGLTSGRETAEAEALWAAVEREAPRAHAPFDSAWFDKLLTERLAPAGAVEDRSGAIAAVPVGGAVDPRAMNRRQDWGDAPDMLDFVGRTQELELLRRWVVEKRCRVIAVLGMGGVGKTSLAAKRACPLVRPR